jgi:hypothetical protein
MATGDIETAVWGEIAGSTIRSTVSLLEKTLKTAGFPYEIEHVKHQNWEMMEVLESMSDHTEPIPVLPATTGYKLVIKK